MRRSGSSLGRELELARSFLTILQLRMGERLAFDIRADEALRTTPFIMVTAESKTENVIAAKKAGVNNYIVKPFNAATLKSKIEAVCGA